MVALGNNRNNGSALGAFYLNADNALGNSNGNNWRSRYSNRLKQEIRIILSFSPSKLCNTTQGVRMLSSLARAAARVANAVKHLHNSAVSSFGEYRERERRTLCLIG